MAIKAQSSNQITKITVKQSRQNLPIELGQSAQHFNNLSELWATSPNIVENKDYSSKYYANKANESATKAESAKQLVIEAKDRVIAEVQEEAQIQMSTIQQVSQLEQEEIQEVINRIEDGKAVYMGEDEPTDPIYTVWVSPEDNEFDLKIEEIKEMIKKAGGGLEIGDIGIAPLGIDETKGKRRYLNGQIIVQDQYTVLSEKVKNAITLYPSLSCTESEWQTIATMSVGGQVGKFVVDDEGGTIRLPKIIMPIQGLTDLSKLAEIVEAGLPNITGNLSPAIVSDHADYCTGAFIGNNGGISEAKTRGVAQIKSTGAWGYNFNASRCSSVYGSSNTVQQEQIQYPYFIQVATGAETEDNIINEIELNNPYSLGDSKYSPVALNNISWLKSEGQYNSNAIYPAYYEWLLKIYNGVEVADGVSVKLTTEEYTDYDWVLNTADETFRLPLLNGGENIISDKYIDLTLGDSGKTYPAPANGHFYVRMPMLNQYGYIEWFNETNKLCQTDNNYGGTPFKGSVFTECKKGEVVKLNYLGRNTANSAVLRFYYNKGNGSLYYYVGETVQNANLINAGRIEEKIVNKIDRSEIKAYIVETYQNGSSWYRVWSDGWCEQGGRISAPTTPSTTEITTTLLKSYKNTSYTLLITQSDTSVMTYSPTIKSKANNKFIIYAMIFDNDYINWYACGYIS